MKNPILTTAVGLALASTLACAGPILFYDSDGANALSRIATETDAAFVSASDAATSIGSGTTFGAAQASQALTVTLGSGTDLQWSFGTGVVNGTAAESLDAGLWLGTSFTAAQSLALDQLSFKLYNNSSNGSNYAARDVAAFVRVGASGPFTQFGAFHDSTAGNGNQGTITFTDTFNVPASQTVQIRFAFTDRTNTASNLQSATRIGSIGISAVAVAPLVVIADTTAPGAGPVSHPTNGSFTKTFGQFSTNPYWGRGQTFTAADTGDANTRWSVTELALLAKSAQTFGPGDTIRLWVFEWLPSSNANDMINWTTDAELVASDGLADGDLLDGTTVGQILVNAVDYSMPASIANGDYLHFPMANALELDENTAYGTFFQFIDADGSTGGTFVQLGIGAGGSTYPGGRQLRTTDVTNDSFDQDMTFFVTGTAIPGPPASDLDLGSPYQDGMVLQRGKPITIWGNAAPSAAVSVTFDGTTTNGTADATGKWKFALPTHAAGGPYTLEVTSLAETITLNDVLVGDVWLAFGQSNMVRPLSEMTNASSYITPILNNTNIRCLKINQKAATSPQEEGPMTWLYQGGSKNPGSWTSVGAVFAYQSFLATQAREGISVPTAIIWAAWGSTSIEGWMPVEMTEQFPHFDAIMDDYYANDEATVTAMLNGTQTYNDVFIRTKPNIVYNQMVHPLLNFGISGFVWYQGEANATAIKDCAQYGFTLPGFVKEYRTRFGQGDLPFLGVQLPSHNRTNWPWFRESQGKVETVPNGHYAVTIDTGDSSNIHPFDKEPIGVRLSLLARKHLYGESIVAEGPRFDSMSVSGNQVTITFTNASGLNANVSASLFQLAGPGANPTFSNANAVSVSGNQVTISSGSVSNPVAARYAWIPVPVNSTNLKNSAGLPAAPFRTDSYALPGLGAEAPQSVADSYEAIGNQPLVVPATGVLANDMDINHDPLTAVFVSGVSNGSLALNADGSFTYTPTNGFTGTDSFVYKCFDGGLNSPNATVSINVVAPATGYAPWSAGIAWNPGDDQSETGDPDFDDIPNFLEFALDLDPLVSSQAGLPTLTPSGGGDYHYDFNNAQPGVTYEVLLSTDLGTWSDPPFASLTSTAILPVIIPVGQAVDGRLFVRLKVTE